MLPPQARLPRDPVLADRGDLLGYDFASA